MNIKQQKNLLNRIKAVSRGLVSDWNSDDIDDVQQLAFIQAMGLDNPDLIPNTLLKNILKQEIDRFKKKENKKGVTFIPTGQSGTIHSQYYDINGYEEIIDNNKFNTDRLRWSTQNPETVLLEAERRSSMHHSFQSSLGALTDKQRVIFDMHHFDVMTQQEVADRLGVSQQYIHSVIQDCIEAIKEELR